MRKLKLYSFIAIFFILLIGIIFLRIFNCGEDDYIKNSIGIYVKHGNPTKIPIKVLEQQKAILCANELYSSTKNLNFINDSKCLGKCGNYSVAIRQINNFSKNLCEDYTYKITSGFIEMDNYGKILIIYP